VHGIKSRKAVRVAWQLAFALSFIAMCAGCAQSRGLAVRVDGNRLVDAGGRTIRLLGVDRSGGEYACVQGLGFFEGPTDAQAIAAMAAWRINTVRLPLNEDCWLGINGAPAQYSGARYRAAVRAYVSGLNNAGLYVVLDLHWNAPARERATQQQPMADLDHAPAFWSSVASTFRTNPAVIFDLYNEPVNINWKCWLDGCMLHGGWRTAGMQMLVDAVRSTGARQPIIVSGLDAGDDISGWLRYRPHDPISQLVAGFHIYNFMPCTKVGCWNQDVAPVAQQAPVVTTEMGETWCKDVLIKSFMSWADRMGVSYIGWSWNPAGCGAPALITSWNGQPTAYGTGLRAHLIRLYQLRQTDTETLP